MSNRLRISLVIPAYNEESYLGECLRSALAQRQPFAEIIVVDNNSTDATALIAGQFPDVKLLRESRQGVVHARNRGFAAASGDIIARIDADTRLPDDWTLEIERVFADGSVGAVTGKVAYYETAWTHMLSLSDNIMRRVVALLLGKNMALQGANMALRRSVWDEVRGSVCNRAGVHEDFDLAIHVVEHGFGVRYAANLRAAVAFRQAASPWRTFANYYWHCPTTYLRHGIWRGYWLVPVAAGMIAGYPLLHYLQHRYRVETRTLPLPTRVNPATFVD